MKKVPVLMLVCSLAFSSVLLAQANTTKQTQHKPIQPALANQANSRAMKVQDSTSLQSTTGHTAFGSRLSIADPTINLLNKRATGSTVPVNGSGVIGMPKGTYGFANGKIFLRSTTATSSGTNYGSGAVATGTSLMGVGTGENTPGLNGKNPYAGPWFWGDRLPNTLTRQPQPKQ